MNAATQPDIEIYIRDASLEEIVGWLRQRLGEPLAMPSKGPMSHYQCERDGIPIPVHIFSGAVARQWTSVWLDSPDTPWADDLACARDCFAFLAKEVRCAAGTWQGDEDDPDAFIGIDADGERHLTWKTQ